MLKKVNARVWPVCFTNHPIYSTDGQSCTADSFAWDIPAKVPARHPPRFPLLAARSTLCRVIFFVYLSAREAKKRRPRRACPTTDRFYCGAAEMRRDAAI